jgi:hypothetical protein
MNKAEWDQLKVDLSHAYGQAHLVVDGFRLTLMVRQTGALKYEITPYVNGEFKGIWLRDKTDEAVRFMCPNTISLFKPAEKKRLTKGLSKKLIKEWLPNIDAKGTYYVWGWSSFTSLKAHLIKNNKSIELVKPEPTAVVEGAGA